MRPPHRSPIAALALTLAVLALTTRVSAEAQALDPERPPSFRGAAPAAPAPLLPIAEPPPIDDPARTPVVLELSGRVGVGGVAMDASAAYRRGLRVLEDVYAVGLAVALRDRPSGFGAKLSIDLAFPGLASEVFRSGLVDLRASQRLELAASTRNHADFALVVEGGLAFVHGADGQADRVVASAFDALGPVVAGALVLRLGTFMVSLELAYRYARTLRRAPDAPVELDALFLTLGVGGALPLG